MVTGIEVAGLTLAAIPLLISALENYNQTKGALRRFVNKAQYVKQLIECLDEQMTLLETDLRMLLKQAGYDEEAQSISWLNFRELLAEQAVSKDVKEALGRHYEPYLRALERCNRSVVEIANNMKGLTDNPKFTIMDLAELAGRTPQRDRRFQLRSRIKVSLDKENLEKQLRDLNSSREMMQKLRISGTEVADEEEFLQSRTISKIARFLAQVQKQAMVLFSAIGQSWQETCHGYHKAHLELTARDEALWQRTTTIRFQVCFSSDVHANNPSPEPLQLIEVEPLRGKAAAQITDLCHELNLARQTSKQVKLYLCNTSQLLYVEGNTEGNTATAQSRSLFLRTPVSVTLKQLIEMITSISNIERLRFWSLPTRMSLAFKLGSSALQLSSTPWLARNWSKENVRFYARQRTQPEAGQIPYEIDTKQVFVSKTFGAGSDEQDMKGDPPRLLLELAILLLEILQEQTFEAYITSKSSTLEDTHASRYSHSAEWYNDVAPSMLTKYRGAVSFCLQWSLPNASPAPDWNNLEFRNRYCTAVLKPLWDMAT